MPHRDVFEVSAVGKRKKKVCGGDDVVWGMGGEKRVEVKRGWDGVVGGGAFSFARTWHG